MKKETYIKMTQPFRDYPELARGIHILNQLCTGIMYVSYPLLLLYLWLNSDIEHFEVFLKALFVPAISFLLLSLGRNFLNRPRPYETFDISPVIKKDTKGKSFPSRHVFSATIVAMTFSMLSPWSWLGLTYLCVTILLAVVRVVSGVHYVSDVFAGMIIGVLAAIVGYVVI